MQTPTPDMTDAAAPRAEQGRAFYTGDTAAQTRLALLSLVFLSPAGTSPRAPLATLLRDGAQVTQYTCFGLQCRGEGKYGAHHLRDLAGLLEASSRPATSEHLFLDTPAEAWQAHAALVARSDVVLDTAPEWPAPDAPWYPNAFYIYPGAALLPLAENNDVPRINEAACEARFRAAFDALFSGSGYDVGAMRFSYHSLPEGGWPVLAAKGDTVIADCVARALSGYGAAEGSAYLVADDAMARRMMQPGALDRTTSLADEQSRLALNLAAPTAPEIAGDCADCYPIRIPVQGAGRAEIAQGETRGVYLPYYLIQTE